MIARQRRRRPAYLARDLIAQLRSARHRRTGVDAFTQEYALSSEEGVVLMCLAESLLRVPDAETQDRLIRDKIAGRAWDRHLGHSDSLFVNASTWALMLTGQRRRSIGQHALGFRRHLAARRGAARRTGDPAGGDRARSGCWAGISSLGGRSRKPSPKHVR